jgi:hypothetical protein
MRQEAGEQQGGLSWNGQPGILAEQGQRHGPIAVVSDKPAERLEDRMTHVG